MPHFELRRLAEALTTSKKLHMKNTMKLEQSKERRKQVENDVKNSTLAIKDLKKTVKVLKRTEQRMAQEVNSV